VGPQIRGSLEDEAFVESTTDIERAAWESFKWICSNFLGRKKSPEFIDGIQKLLNAYKETGSRMSLKVHFFALTFRFISRKPLWSHSESIRMNAFIMIRVNLTTLSRLLERPSFGRLLLDILPRCSRHSAPQKGKVITFLTVAFSRYNDVVYTKSYFMYWNCANVCDLPQFLRILEIKLSRKKYTCQESLKSFS
jgi:hypothetical protein